MTFIFAIVLVCMAHLIRVYRWSLLVKTYEKPPMRVMLQALSLGYVVNYFLPFKLGDIAKAFVAGRKMKNGKGFALGTVIIERCMDVLVVGIIFGIFQLMGIDDRGGFSGYCILALIIAVVLLLAAFLRKYIKKCIFIFAGIFNEHLEEVVLCFSWALVCCFKDIILRISKWKLIISTIMMWGLYLYSYWFFALFLDSNDWKEVFFDLFEVKAMLSGQIRIDSTFLWYSLYLLLPSLLLFGLSWLLKASTKNLEKAEYLNLIPHVNSEDRKNFLELYFSSENPNFVENYLSINRKVLVLRDYSAGSNATTILCTDGTASFYRKYAFGAEGNKLHEQVEWIHKFKNRLPLPEIIFEENNEDYCFYDMPYINDAIGLFDYAHSAPKEAAWDIIRQALNCLENKLYSVNAVKADEATIKKYIQEKVHKNLQKIYEAKQIKPLLHYKSVIINGKEYRNLPEYEKYLSEEKLLQIFSNDLYSDIHGDLTVENIIYDKSNRSGVPFYLIDPNTGNVHNSANLDYAKLLQSIHGNYEFLMATKKIDCEENHLQFNFIKSDAYDYLLKQMDTYMNESFSKEKIRSIYYHEIVHWLRLIPYKISKNGSRALLFYAGLLFVLDDVTKRFES